MTKFFSLASGSSANAAFVSDGRTNVLIDCGLNGKNTQKSLSDAGADVSDIDAILITHEHIDHIAGAGVLSRRFDIPIYATPKTLDAMVSDKCAIGKISGKNLCPIEKDSFFEIGSLGVCAFSIPHDSADPVGYNIFLQGGKRKFCVATDMGKVDKDAVGKILGSECVILESNHDVDMLNNGSYPYYLKQRILGVKGHLSNESSAKIAACLAKNGTKSIVLGHLSKENNLPRIAYDVSKAAIEREGVKVGKDMVLNVALRSEITSVLS